MRKLIPLLALIGLSACTSASDVAKFAEMEGWQSYEVTGYRFFGCGQDDWYSTGFTAVKNGKRFTGVVCSGLLVKAATLRLD